MSDWIGLVWLVVLVIANAFFVAAEFAVVAARRAQIEPLAAQGRRGARSSLWAMEHATLMLATTQLGITVCSLLILGVSEPAIHHLLAAPLALTGLAANVIEVVSLVVAIVIVSFLHVVFGELVPKNISVSVPDRAALLLVPALVAIARVLRPIIVALNATANGVLHVFRVTPRSETASAFTLDEVATIVDRSAREGLLSDRSGTVNATFEFSAKKARDVAIAVDSLVRLTSDASPADVERAVAKHGFSRYLVDDGHGHLLGYLHVKDVLDLEAAGFEDPVPAHRRRRFASLSADDDLEDVIALMRRSGVHLAEVGEADGSPVGVLFLEDAIEELVGEVQDATRRRPDGA